jgi:hypothetical protein
VRSVRRSSLVAALGILTALHGRAASAQRSLTPPRAATLTVWVADSADAAIPGAEIAIATLGVTKRTDADGRVALTSLPEGRFLVVARRFGFLPDSQRAALHAGGATTLSFRLRTSAYLLDTARVESAALRDRMVDFERRRTSGRGTFITREDVDRRNPLTLADMLRAVRGLTVRTVSGRTELRFARADARLVGADCPPEIWIDGVRAFDATVDEIHPAEVEGIELYRGLGQIPAEYLSRTAACGLVLIWTRSPSRVSR